MLGRRRFPGDVFHVDLLGPARRLWSARLADCRLGTVEQDVLGLSPRRRPAGRADPHRVLRVPAPQAAGRAAARVRAQPARHPLARRAHRLGRGRGGARAASRARSGSAGRARPDARGARTRSGAWRAIAWRSTSVCRRPRASACCCGSRIARSGWRAGTRRARSGRRRPTRPASSTRGRGRRSPRSTSIAAAISRRRSRWWSRPWRSPGGTAPPRACSRRSSTAWNGWAGASSGSRASAALGSQPDPERDQHRPARAFEPGAPEPALHQRADPHE